MDKEKEIEEIKLIIVENMAIYSKAKMPYEEALRMCALGILASGYGNVKQAVKEFAERAKTIIDDMSSMADQEWAMGQIDNLITELYGADDKE